MNRICKVCGINEASRHYFGLCFECRKEKYLYTKNKKCADCGKRIINTSTRCSPCKRKREKNRVERTCTYCGVVYTTIPSNKRFFCSVKCKQDAYTDKVKKGGENSPAWRGGKENTQRSGYVYTYSHEHKKRVRVHMRIAEKVLGRKLKPNELVHHIDMDKTNNQNSNLLICDKSYHRWLHYQMELDWVKKVLKAK